MENLPTPLNRVELYLGAAAQMAGVTPPEAPLSRLEQYLAFIAGDTSVELPAPASLCEQWLAYVAGITPAEPLALEGAFHVGVQKVDVRFFAAAAGMPGVIAPEPQNRTEQFWAKLAEILPVHGTLKYATGTNLTLTDVAWWRMGLERINGDTTQQTYTGKNLFNINADQRPNTRCTATINGEAITITSTVNSTGFYCVLVPNSDNLLGQTAILSIGEVTSDTHGRIYVNQAVSTNLTSVSNSVGSVQSITSGSSATLNLTFPNSYVSGKDCFVITFYVSDQGQYTTAGSYSTYSNIQLEIGSTATAFEPYVGGVPAPNPDYPQAINTVTGEQTVTVASPNLLTGTVDFSGDWERDTYWTTEPETYNGLTVKSRKEGWNGIYKTFAVKSGETYTFSVYAKAGSNRTSRIYLGNPGSAEVTSPTRSDISITTEWQRFSVTFTTTANGTIAPRVENTAAQSTPTYICGYQLQTGATATDFQPYQKTEYKINLGDIELCKIGTYQDYIYRNGNDWYIQKATKKVSFNGTEGWSRLSGNVAFRLEADFTDLVSATDAGTAMSDYFIYWPNTASIGTNLPDGQFGWRANKDAIAFRDDGINLSLSGWKTWLSLHNPSVYYALGTPTDTKITNQALISQLNALDRAVLPQPIAYITASGDLTGELKISYYGEEE